MSKWEYFARVCERKRGREKIEHISGRIKNKKKNIKSSFLGHWFCHTSLSSLAKPELKGKVSYRLRRCISIIDCGYEKRDEIECPNSIQNGCENAIRIMIINRSKERE